MAVIKFNVSAERSNCYVSAKTKEEVRQQIISVADKTAGGGGLRLSAMWEYVLSPAEKLAYSGKLEDKTILMAVRTVEEWQGAIRIRDGEILEIDGKPTTSALVGSNQK